MGLVIVVALIVGVVLVVDSGKGWWGFIVWGSGGRWRATMFVSIVIIVLAWLLYVGAKGGGCKPHC